MLTPFDDFPIHPSADPIAHPATGDPNHYDRYWFNGQAKDGSFFLGGAMGHYPGSRRRRRRVQRGLRGRRAFGVRLRVMPLDRTHGGRAAARRGARADAHYPARR